MDHIGSGLGHSEDQARVQAILIVVHREFDKAIRRHPPDTEQRVQIVLRRAVDRGHGDLHAITRCSLKRIGVEDVAVLGLAIRIGQSTVNAVAHSDGRGLLCEHCGRYGHDGERAKSLDEGRQAHGILKCCVASS